MKGDLIRYESTSEGTFGILTIDQLRVHTLERPWINNEPFKSCIPPGFYQIRPFTRNSGDEVFALVGDTVSIYKEDGFKRYAILIHSGNYMTDVVGCIAPGLTRHDNMVANSRMAMSAIMESGLTSLNISFGESNGL